MATGARFASVPIPQIKRTAFDRSHEHKMTADFQRLYPFLLEDVIPGDVYKIGISSVIRCNPLVAPVMHEITAYFHYFFVPYRLVDLDFEEMISGGIDGISAKIPPLWPTLPSVLNTGSIISAGGEKASWLWDYFGFPTDIDITSYNSGSIPIKPVDYPRRAYYFIFSQYYMDEDYPWTLSDPLLDNAGRFRLASFSAATGGTGDNRYRQNCLNRYWRRDYFTSVRPFQQRGPAAAFDIAGDLPLVVPAGSGLNVGTNQTPVISQSFASGTTANVIAGTGYGSSDSFVRASPGDPLQPGALLSVRPANLMDVIRAATPSPYVSLSNGVSFNVADLRSTVQLQKWMERNARSGVRYTEFLRAHFAVAPRDERLDRPEYLGGTSTPVIISEVLQTSASASGSTPQANMAGHGIQVGGDRICTYHVKEFGLIMGLMSIMVRPAYEDRLDRQWIKRSRFDFYFPEFAHLSEAGVMRAELRYNALANDDGVIGYQPIYEYYRSAQDYVSGLFRQSRAQNLATWHCARHFTAGTAANINSTFLVYGMAENYSVYPTISNINAKRIFAVPSQDGFLCNIRNHITAIRPLPYDGTPGFVDHF